MHKQGGSALIEAATAGNVTVMQTLLGAGADPLIVDDDGVTALMSAASQGHTEIAKCVTTPSMPPRCPLYTPSVPFPIFPFLLRVGDNELSPLREIYLVTNIDTSCCCLLLIPISTLVVVACY